MIRKLVLPSLLALSLPAGAAYAPATVSTTGSSVTTTVLDDDSTVVTFLSDGTLTLSAGVTARALFVGGGGGGGSGVGGGGGGGGVVALDELALAAGTYTITVGAGGAGGANNNTAATGGGASTMENEGGTAVSPLLPALGGGFGGGWNKRDPGSGATGGASCGGTAPGTGTDGQGYAGGTSGGRSSGGGGGAGGPGGNGDTKGTGVQKEALAVGGVGVTNDITGVAIAYGGGGGGGGGDSGKCPGSPGTDGGGDGTAANGPAGGNGENGRGGGGGGSGWGANTAGGNGGSGVVIVRIAPIPVGPEPILKVLSVEDGPESVLVSAKLTYVGEGSSSATVSYAVAASASALDAATPVSAVAGVESQETVSFAIPGLTAGTAYYVRVLAGNNQGETCQSEDFECLPYATVASAAATGAQRVFDVGRDRVAVFGESSDTMTFTLEERTAVELLLVGGGGGGGSYEGGGGGAGGFLHLEKAVLDAGTYTVAVGAGGLAASANQLRGSNGGDTTLAKYGEARNVYVAHGGGGGGGYSTTSPNRNGQDGGSGGGGGVQSGMGGASTAEGAERGNPGGENPTGYTGQYFASGGGGAGEPGSSADFVLGSAAGKGGDGLPCSITGEEVWYAGGGGAGENDNNTINGVKIPAGSGGRGGGGMGCRTADNVIDDYERGTDGLGGGGGGGRREGTSSAGMPRWGAPGGSGTLIVRWRTAADATARATVDAVAGSAGGVVVSGSVQLGGAAGADIQIAVGPAGGALGAWQTLATGLAAGEGFSLTLSGLDAGTVYDYAVRVVSAGTEGETLGAAAGSFVTAATVPARLSGDPDGATKKTAGSDTVYVFDAPGTYTFTVAATGRARFLMVGGGGAGGSKRGGGGGAGGLVERPSETLAAGTYTVVVGEGGAPSATPGNGGAGGDSTLSRGGAAFFVAHGGGGGGGGGSDLGTVAPRGGAGGSGGGGGSCADLPSVSTAVWPELGHPGAAGSGNAASIYDSAGSGGGGAGGPGDKAVWSDAATGPGRRQGGAGGAGVASDITGATLWYAGGGGGGCWCDDNGGYKGVGGSGVGGTGGGYASEVNQGIASPTAGAAGTGSGGGGGRDGSNYNDTQRRGAAGGCGAFVLRIPASLETTLPDAAIERAAASAADATAVDAAVSLYSTGSAAAADVSIAYGTSESDLRLSAPVATGAAAGTFAARIAGLAPGRTWFFAPVASSAAGVATGAVVSVALPAADASGGAGGGLWQTFARGTADTFRDTFTNAAFWASVQSSNLVAGSIAANTGATDFSDPLTGVVYYWPGAYSMFAYRGYVRLEAGRTYSFGSRFSDCVYLAVDGQVLISSYGDYSTDRLATFTPETTGWHEIDARVGRTGSPWGPNGNGATSWCSFGLAFNGSGITAVVPESAWTPLLDDGSGSILRPTRPAARALALGDATAAGGALELSGAVGPGEEPAHAYLVSGERDFGTRESLDNLAALAALGNLGWTVTDLGAVAASAADTPLAGTVAGWGSAAKVARLVLETDGALAWTEPVAWSETALPALSALSADGTAGDALAVSGSIAGGTAPYAATLLVGASADDLAPAASATVSGAGAFALEATGLAGSQVFWQVVATDATGATVASDVFPAFLAGASRVADRSDGAWDSAWIVANPYSAAQRTVAFGGTLTELGAGETTVFLLRSQGFYGAPAGASVEAHEGESRTVSALGAYTLETTLPDWDADVAWSWAVSNATATASWGPTAAARAAGQKRTLTVLDATEYTWAGGAAGLWTDPAAWTPDGVWSDIAGYPRRGSYATFPAAAGAVVSVPDTEATNRFAKLSIGAGAQVEFRPAPGATDATLRLQSDSNASATRNYARFQGADSTLRFAGRALFADLWGSTAWQPDGAGATLEFADGVRARIGNNTGGGAWSAGGKQDSLLSFKGGATVNVLGSITVTGVGSQMVIDDATVLQGYTATDNSAVFLRGRSMGDKASLVIRGANPVLQAGYRFRTTNGDSADKTQYVDFEVPEGGWRDAPIRTSPSNTLKFGANGSSGYKIVLRIPATSPAVVAGESLDVPLVRWPAGIDTTYVTIDRQYLPHPATDEFYTTTDAISGQKILWAHLVGQADTTAPQAVEFRIRSLEQTGVDLSFGVLPGAGGATSVGVEVLDAGGGAVAGATATATFASTSAFATNFVTVAGLDPATDYLLRVTLDDGSNPVVTTNFPFASLADWGEGESLTADSVAQDGPYTVWTFTDTTPNAGTFTVTRGGLAEILVVGGGGSGGSGHNGSDYGGGGGGGGEVVATSRVLAPGTYTIQVGAGGAKVTGRTSGKNGSPSAFADIVAAGGGGGGYNAAGLSGASGGGGSNGKAGGAATAGFAGGAGASKGGGGGGGGAGAAGAAGASTFGGAGGAGATNSISGYPAVYGAGGGGGSSGSYSVYKGGGAPGAETAGHGAEASFDGRQTAFVATLAATPGFGGGGGGGCASSDGKDSYYGGAGGSGTVIVRMRTQTAAQPAPQAALKADEAGEADWTASLEIYSLGQGASSVAATLRVARDGAATTNDFAMGTLSATGAATLSATGLAPASDYAGVLVLDNGLAGGTLEIPVAFRTADADATTASAASAWSFGKWTSAAADFHATSLIRDSQDFTATIASTGATASEANPTRVADGAEDGYYLYADRLLAWTWGTPVYLTAFRVFYNNADYRSAVNVASVEALGEDGVWTVISPTPGHYNESWGRNYGYLLPASGADFLSDKPALGIRFTTDGFATSDYHNLREVEVEGVLAELQPADLSISSLLRTAAGAKALVAFSHALPADVTVTALVAATHGGTDPAAWTAVASENAAAGALSQNFAIDAADLEGMVYLRFRSDDGAGGVRWSETVYLPDVEILSAIPPVVHFVAVRETTASTATIAASLVDAGSGAVGDAADLYVRYATASGEVAAATAVPVAADAPEGETAAVLSGLMPGRAYWAQVVAVNAEGGSGGTGVSEFFSFETAPDEFGGAAVSSLNGWLCGTWSPDTDQTSDNLLRGLTATETQQGLWKSVGKISYLTDGIINKSEYYGIGPGTALEFELGGVFSLTEFRLWQYSTDTSRRTISVASLEWRDEAGAWHRISGSQLEFDTANNNRAFLVPADGSRYLAAGATAIRFTQGEGGAHETHLIREMELFGEAAEAGAAGFLRVDAASWSGGALAATLVRADTNAAGTVWAVSGAAYHGTNETAWAADGGAAASFGALAENQASVSGSFAPASGARYVRFYETDALGRLVAWSDTLPADPAAPFVVDGGVQADGDLATFPIRVVAAGTGTLSVKVQLAAGDDVDFTNATDIAVADPGVGAFELSAEVVPGATYRYRVVAETTDGGRDVTPPRAFTTLGGSVLLGAVSTSSVSHRFATLRGTLDTLGAGVTTLEILTGDSAGSLSTFETVVLERPGEFALPFTFTGAPRTIYFRFHTVNRAPDGTEWESWSDTGSFTTSDTVTYTWKKDVTEGAWNDPDNWTPSVPYYCTGYPDSSSAGVSFEDGTTATVTVPGKYRFSSWSVARSNLDVTFVGNGPDVSGLGSNNDNLNGGNWKNCSWTFSNLSLTEKDGVNFGDSGKPYDSWNSTFRFTDGSVASFGNAITAAGSNMWIVVENGATLRHRANGPALAVKDGGIRLDGGTIDAARILTDYNWASTTNQAILVSGAAPRIALSTSFRNDSTAAASLQNADTTFLFSVPEVAWRQPVIYSETEDEMFAGLLGDGPGKYVLSIDPATPIFQTGHTRTVTLVAWKGGIDTGHVRIADPPKGATIFYTYGWPSVLTEPANAGDAPTGVRATLRGYAGTLLLIK